MKYFTLTLATFIFVGLLTGCGKKFTYTCLTDLGSANVNGITVQPFVAQMTDKEARRYERDHRKNDDGNDQIVSPNEIQVTCTK